MSSLMRNITMILPIFYKLYHSNGKKTTVFGNNCRKETEKFLRFLFTKWENLAIMYKLSKHAPVAQWIEHRIPVPRVGGSSPFRCTKKEEMASAISSFFFAEEGTRTYKCNSPVDCCSRGLDRAKQQSAQSADANESLPVYQIKERIPIRVSSLLFRPPGGRDSKGRPDRRTGKKCPVDTF